MEENISEYLHAVPAHSFVSDHRVPERDREGGEGGVSRFLSSRSSGNEDGAGGLSDDSGSFHKAGA